MITDAERENRKARRKVIEKYARRKKNGQLIRCSPSREEIENGWGDDGWGSNGKIIYDSVENAMWASIELEALGARPTRAYVCERSKSGHAHLTMKLRQHRIA